MLSNLVGGGKPKMRWYFGEGPHLQLTLIIGMKDRAVCFVLCKKAGYVFGRSTCVYHSVAFCRSPERV